MLALAPTARSIGAAVSRARSMLALRSSSERTSLAGRAVAPSAASSSGVTRAGSWSAMVSPVSSALSPTSDTPRVRTVKRRSSGSGHPGGGRLLEPKALDRRLAHLELLDLARDRHREL